MNNIKSVKTLLLIAVITVAVSCSGGGGGDDGSTTELKRETDTAVRLIHAAVDAAPLEIYGGLIQVTKGRYAQETFFGRVEDENVTELVVARANTAATDIVRRIPVNLAEDTEYTLFVYGKVGDDAFRYNFIIDNIERPDNGACIVRLFNGLPDSGDLTLGSKDFAQPGVRYGVVSSFRHSACGPQIFTITSPTGTLARVSIDLPEESEATIVLSGDKDLGYVKAVTYLDLD
ncbi:MAG: DUF4397 domain-containing protein [Deltaproteobacteria bacterium]|nr:DUF4397 domain-containing protein [Deltaproteobacteria bacterium]